MRVKFDMRQVNLALKNTIDYTNGFLTGTQEYNILLNNKIADLVKESLGMYVDAMARSNPESLHHVYEWGMVGNQEGRLFELETQVSGRKIIITSKFLQSTSIQDGSSTPFYNKAEIMENGVTVTISPKNSDVLAFQEEGSGEIVFTKSTVVVTDPGGQSVKGSFGQAIQSFFDGYFQATFMKDIINHLQNPREYSREYSRNANASTGRRAALHYMTKDIGEFI